MQCNSESRADSLTPERACGVLLVSREYHSFYSPTGIFMVRHGNYKLILFGSDKVFDQPFPPQLFDLTKDPHEMTNVANELPEVVSAMSLLMDNEVDIEKADSDCKEYNLERFKTAFYTVRRPACSFRDRVCGVLMLLLSWTAVRGSCRDCTHAAVWGSGQLYQVPEIALRRI